MTTATPATANAVPDTLTGNYRIDPNHSRIGFVARHAMVTKVRGSFNDFDGSGYLDVADPTKSHLALTIKAASIDTRNADRDAHLKSNDFFAMDEFPEIAFVSTQVEPSGAQSYRVTGDLTLKGITKPVSFELEFTGQATDPFGNKRIGLEGSTTINRKDWGITFNVALDAGGVLVSENVTLEFEVSAIRVAEEEPAA